MSNLEKILQKSQGYEKTDRDLVKKAYLFAKGAHAGISRNSGEPYLNHLVETATTLAQMGMQSKAVAAGLLHDSVEDGVATEEELLEKFGEEISFLVGGVTKLGKVRFQGMKRHNESLRKLFVATSRDIRVLIIKFADRIHNMETLMHVREDKRLRIATETLEIYAPLAYRLGIATLSKRLEDLSFPYVYPEEHQKVQDILKERSKSTVDKLEKVSRTIKRKLAENNLSDFRTVYRIKGLYSLYKKLLRKDWDLEKVYDIAALRVIVKDFASCYKALGIIHQHYRPIPGRIKDYIAFEKPNGYQSIHTTIFTGDGGIVEIQIRTEEMHRIAEYGAASHLGYKVQSGSISGIAQRDEDWVQKLLHIFWRKKDAETEKATEDSQPKWVKDLANYVGDESEDDNLDFDLKEDFFRHRIFVFTPLGEAIDLPNGSSPVDFAYQIHSEVGDHISGAKIFGKMVSLDSELKNGDVVEILTNRAAKPNLKWLDFVKTSLAKRKIRQAKEQK